MVFVYATIDPMRRFLFSFVITAFCLTAVLTSPTPANAQATKSWKDIQSGCVSSEVVPEGTADVATLQGLECVVQNILGIAMSAIGIAAFVMLLIGSFLYLASGGNPKSTDAAKKTITMAITGIVVALLGWIIINFIGVFTGTGEKVTIFRINQDQAPGAGPKF